MIVKQIKMKPVNDVTTESSKDISIVLEGGKGTRCFLTINNDDKQVELCYVEISKELFWALKSELGVIQK
jgi:hypothetical protein